MRVRSRTHDSMVKYSRRSSRLIVSDSSAVTMVSLKLMVYDVDPRGRYTSEMRCCCTKAVINNTKYLYSVGGVC